MTTAEISAAFPFESSYLEILPGAVVRDLSEEEMNAYREPFLDPAHRKPLWRWPNELPIAGEPPDTAEAVDANFTSLQQSVLPNLITADLGNGIHYLQEDHPHEIGDGIANWYRAL